MAVAVTAGGGKPDGTLTEEVLQLIGTLRAVASGGSAGSAEECRFCPVCRLVAGVRQLRPEAFAHLVAAAEELLAAVQEFTASSSAAATGSGATATGSEATGTGPGAAARKAPARSPARVREPIALD